jgi:hypothetical protein
MIGTACNGYFACTCYHPLFLFNQFGQPGAEDRSSAEAPGGAAVA